MFDAWLHRSRKLGPGVHSDFPERTLGPLIISPHYKHFCVFMKRRNKQGLTNNNNVFYRHRAKRTRRPSVRNRSCGIGGIWNNKYLQGILHGVSRETFHISSAGNNKIKGKGVFLHQQHNIKRTRGAIINVDRSKPQGLIPVLKESGKSPK